MDGAKKSSSGKTYEINLDDIFEETEQESKINKNTSPKQNPPEQVDLIAADKAASSTQSSFPAFDVSNLKHIQCKRLSIGIFKNCQTFS